MLFLTNQLFLREEWLNKFMLMTINQCLLTKSLNYQISRPIDDGVNAGINVSQIEAGLFDQLWIR